MIRILRYLFLAALAVILVTVALANREQVTVLAIPANLAEYAGVQWSLTLPLYIVIFGGIIAGILIGFLWEWLREHKHRSVASTKTKEVARLERELAVMRDTKPEHKDDVLAILDKRKAS